MSLEGTSFWSRDIAINDGQSSELPPKSCLPEQISRIWERVPDPRGVWASEMLSRVL